MPPVCGEIARYWVPSEYGQALPGGRTWKMAAGPVGWGQEASAIDGPQSGQKPTQDARCSVKKTVLDEPSRDARGEAVVTVPVDREDLGVVGVTELAEFHPPLPVLTGRWGRCRS